MSIFIFIYVANPNITYPITYNIPIIYLILIQDNQAKENVLNETIT